MEGVIFDIKHYALHDGPGIRQTVFLKGCPLSCWWCHNPESRGRQPFTYEKEEKMDGRIIRETETVGYKISVTNLLAEIERDLPFFEESGGGVTFSGGEPLLQFDFLKALLQGCRLREIHTCVDTTAYVEPGKLRETAKFTNLFLVDIKQMDDAEHRKYTGVNNKQILQNIRMLDEMGKEIVIRYPMIPGINDDESNLLRMMAFLSELKHKPEISILPYHKIGSHKYARFGMEYKMADVKEPAAEAVENIQNLFEKGGFKTNVGG
jgi:pyruvate formate lyase activating enzyme